MTWAMVEAAADSIIDYMDTNAAAKLSDIESRNSDSITLPDFRSIHFARPSEAVTRDFPVLFVMAPMETINVRSTGLTAGFHENARVDFAVVYELTVNEVGAGTIEGETLQRMGKRYGVALLEMLADSISSTGYEWATGGSTSLQYGQQFINAERTTLVSSVLLTTSVQIIEGGL